jgi:hypothetical protein
MFFRQKWKDYALFLPVDLSSHKINYQTNFFIFFARTIIFQLILLNAFFYFFYFEYLSYIVIAQIVRRFILFVCPIFRIVITFVRSFRLTVNIVIMHHNLMLMIWNSRYFYLHVIIYNESLF